MKRMSDAASSHDDGDDLVMVPIDEAIRIARPWEPLGGTGLEDVTDDEWDAFIESLSKT
jgi:hypothetical protein